MAKPSLAQDQTVEDILASIRQVINGDHARQAPARPGPRIPPAAAAPRGGTLTTIRGGKVAVARDEATMDSRDEGSAAPASGRIGRPQVQDVVEQAIEEALGALNGDKSRSEPAPAVEIEPPRQMAGRPRYERRPQREMPRMIEAPPRAAPPPAARSLLSAEADAAVAASFEDLDRALARAGAGAVDAAVEDLLRPLLKRWLEDNLPSMVERLVREEIERVSRGRR